MAGIKGRSGTNKGQDRPFRDALMLAINECDGDQKKLRKVAEKLVEKAMDGDVTSIKEIADRIDGKPQQSVEVDASIGLRHEDALDELK